MTVNNIRQNISSVSHENKPVIDKKFIEAGQGLGQGLGKGLIAAIEDAIAEFLSESGPSKSNGNLRVKTFMEKISDIFNANLQTGVGSIDLTKSAAIIGDKVRNAINQAGGGAVEGAEDVMSRFSQKVAMAALPYVVSSLALIAGTPLVAHYFYKKAVQNLGKPKLAAEIYKVNDLERLGDHIQMGIKQGIQIAGSALKWGAITASLGMASILPAFLLGEYRSIGAPASERPAYLDHPEEYAKTIAQVSGIVAGGTASYQLVKQTFSSLKNYINAVSDPTPIFNDKISSSIEEIVESTRNIRQNGGFFQNVLLYGPGGTGKTMVAKRIAKQSGMNYISLSGGALPECIKRGEHITEIKKLFASITEPTVVFVDEIESLAKNRDLMQRPEELELINELLNLTGTDSNLVLLIAATNKPGMIDRDMITRFNRKLFISPPGHDERIRILDEHIPYFFTRKERATVLNPFTVNQMAEYTERLTGRALFKMLNSIYAKKMMSKDKVLRPEMVSSTMEQFVEQERELDKWRTESFYTNLPAAPVNKPASLLPKVKRIGDSFLRRVQRAISA